MTIRLTHLWIMLVAWIACDVVWAIVGKSTARDRIGEDMAIAFFLFWATALALVLNMGRGR